MLLRRRKPARMAVRRSPRVRSHGHLAWVRGFSCLAFKTGECEGKVQAAHVRGGTDGAMGEKPSDFWSVPLCAKHHAEQHNIGEAAFERKYELKMREAAARLWWISPHGQRYRREQEK